MTDNDNYIATSSAQDAACALLKYLMLICTLDELKVLMPSMLSNSSIDEDNPDRTGPIKNTPANCNGSSADILRWITCFE